jgi:hypothetical protein
MRAQGRTSGVAAEHLLDQRGHCTEGERQVRFVNEAAVLDLVVNSSDHDGRMPVIRGAAVRLVEAGEERAVAEGPETALAVHLATGKPVWAAISARNLEQLWLPGQVRRVCIDADNDADGGFEGQACAFALARRLARGTPPEGARQVRVFLPRQPGHDWTDVWSLRATAHPDPQPPAA